MSKLTLEQAVAVAADEVEKRSCLSDEDAKHYAMGVLDGYTVAVNYYEEGEVVWYTEAAVRELIAKSLALASGDDDEDEG